MLLIYTVTKNNKPHMGMIHREEGTIFVRFKRQLKQITFLGESKEKATSAHRKPPIQYRRRMPPKHGFSSTGESSWKALPGYKVGGTGIHE